MATNEYTYAVCSAADWGSAGNYAGKGSAAARDAYYDGYYTSLTAWEAGRNKDLTTSSDKEIAEILGDDWSGNPDVHVVFGGWTCNRGNDEIVVIKTVDNGFSPSARNDFADGKKDTTNYMISEDSSNETIDWLNNEPRQDFDFDEKQLKRIEGIINSMTREERLNHSILNGSRKRRIAKGSGTRVQDINRLLKNYAQVMKMMKKFNKGGMRKLGRGMLPF